MRSTIGSDRLSIDSLVAGVRTWRPQQEIHLRRQRRPTADRIMSEDSLQSSDRWCGQYWMSFECFDRHLEPQWSGTPMLHQHVSFGLALVGMFSLFCAPPVQVESPIQSSSRLVVKWSQSVSFDRHICDIVVIVTSQVQSKRLHVPPGSATVRSIC